MARWLRKINSLIILLRPPWPWAQEDTSEKHEWIILLSLSLLFTSYRRGKVTKVQILKLSVFMQVSPRKKSQKCSLDQEAGQSVCCLTKGPADGILAQGLASEEVQRSHEPDHNFWRYVRNRSFCFLFSFFYKSPNYKSLGTQRWGEMKI